MKVLLLKADATGCGFYRMEEPARVAQANGVDVEIRDYINATMNGDRKVHAVTEDADVVVFQRPMDSRLVQAIPLLQAQGKKVIVELDDDLCMTPTHNAAYRAVAPKHSPDHNWDYLQRACRQADAMIVSTPALSKYKPNGRVTVIRNCVPEWMTKIDHERGAGVGWSGTIAVHGDDLSVVRGALREFPMRIVGEKEGVKDALGLTEEPTETGWLPVREYLSTLGQLDVGIAPLSDTAFNRAKSSLKIMEFSASAVPFVCSPSEEYLHFIGNTRLGLIARKPKEWRRAVGELMASKDAREGIGGSLREHVKARWTYERNISQWVDAWHSVLA